MTTGFHVFAETETHIVEADCEVDYTHDAEATHPSDRFYPVRYRWYDVFATDKQTGDTEFWGEEMPGSLLNVAREKAEEEFYEQL